MVFPFNVYLMAGLGAAVTTALSFPVWRWFCLRYGFIDEPGHRKIHSHPIPLAGGLAVLTGLFLPVIAGAVLLIPHVRAEAHRGAMHGYSVPDARVVWKPAVPNPAATDVANSKLKVFDLTSSKQLAFGLYWRAAKVGAIIIGALIMVLIGLLDDRYELGAGVKFAGQFLAAGLVALAGTRITFFGDSPPFAIAVTIFWILTIANAMNFMDNMNGLCTGLGVIGAWYFGLCAASEGQYLVALMGFLSCGALLGFLPFNFPRARAFLGDAGSHLVGYMLAVLAVLPHFRAAEKVRVWPILIPLLVLAVPLYDLASVVLIRWRANKPFWVGDTNHLSHRLTRRGYSKSMTVLLIWLMAALAGGLAVY